MFEFKQHPSKKKYREKIKKLILLMMYWENKLCYTLYTSMLTYLSKFVSVITYQCSPLWYVVLVSHHSTNATGIHIKAGLPLFRGSAEIPRIKKKFFLRIKIFGVKLLLILSLLGGSPVKGKSILVLTHSGIVNGYQLLCDTPYNY